MEDWIAFESRVEGLAVELEEAKKHPFNVKMDFETRFRVWRDQIIPDRLLQLEKHLTLETAIRYYGLTLNDVKRLYRRSSKEFLEVANSYETTQKKLVFHQMQYLARQNLLYNVHDGYVNDMKDMIER